tara:strand:+ start:443 stop:1648 length:1206 start_codon:yes stop_codon:yes gene_type:complete
MQSFIQNKLKQALGLETKSEPKNKNPSRDVQGANDPLAHMKINDKWSYTTLEYPEDLQRRSDLGHYMLFYINVPVQSKYQAGQHGAKHYEVGKAMEKQETTKPKPNPRDIYSFSKVPAPNPAAALEQSLLGKSSSAAQENNGLPGQKGKVVQRTHHQGTIASKIGTQRLTRTNSAIALYMPPQIQANYLSAYKESEMGAIVGMGAEAFQEAKAEALGLGANTGGIESFKNIMQMGAEQVKKAAQSSLSAAGADIIGASEKLGNIAQNNFLEVMYSGPAFRKFSYTWKLTPKSPQEAIEIDKIIRTFKFHMLPEIKPETAGRYYILPAEFDIFYMFRGDENTYLNRITSCVCTGVDVNYTPNQYQTNRPINGRNGAPPSEIDFKLDFMETKLITKEDILQGY